MVDLGEREDSAGTTYVAQSRTKGLQRLWIVGKPPTSRLTTPHSDTKAGKVEQKRLKKLPLNTYMEIYPVILKILQYI